MTSRSLLEQTSSLEWTLMLKIAEPLNLFYFSCLDDGLNRVTLENNGSGSLKCWSSSVPWCDEHINFLCSWSMIRPSTKNYQYLQFSVPVICQKALSVNTTQTYKAKRVKWKLWLSCCNVIFNIFVLLLLHRFTYKTLLDLESLETEIFYRIKILNFSLVLTLVFNDSFYIFIFVY